jgi:predicted AlkP superfamily pyrophosphatase or phosphodiesterase
MKRVCVIDLPGMSRELLKGVPKESAMGKWAATKRVRGLTPTWPAVTCSIQATITTGTPPIRHGIVGNGVATYRSPVDQGLVDASNFAEYRRNVSFWEQSNQFVQVPRFWQHENGTSKYKTALLFFQHSMPGFSGTPKPAADIVLTPKPDHGPDGKLVSLCWSQPDDLVPRLFKELGPFPLMNYWGPMAGIASSQWIAKAAARVWRTEKPTLQLVYVPHLDYDLQRFGPRSPQATKAVADVAAAIEPLLAAVLEDGGEVVLLSEYSIAEVNRSIQPNLLLREAGLLQTENTADGELIDYQRSKAFAMVDHQIAHLYSNDSQAAAEMAKAGLKVLDHRMLNHPRAGEALLEAPAGAWLDYRWWKDAGDAPAFAATVDIHRKPGYDPLELFFDPATRKISQNAGLVRGSHGRVTAGEAIIIGEWEGVGETMLATEVAAAIESALHIDR